MSKETQLAVVNGSALTEKDVMSAIQNVLIRLHKSNDVQESVNVINTLDRIGNVAGHAKAYLLWGMNEWWKTNKPNESLGDHVESTTPTKSITVSRYVNVWQQIEDEKIPKVIQSRPMRELVPIASMLSQGYEPTKEQWKKIELSDNDLGSVLSEIKGTKPRKSGLKIYLEKDGSLNVWKNNKKTYLGFLDVEEAQTNPDLAKAIERIVSSAQIIRR